MIVKLRTQQGRKPSPTLILRGPEAIFGRAHGNKVRIPSSDVSRQHCRLCIRDNKVTIEDLASLNGTFLNKKRTEGEVEVHSGDRIQVGPVTFIVEMVMEESDTSRPEEPNELAPVNLEEVDVTLLEDEPAVSPKTEPAGQKRKPLPEKDKRGEGQSGARPEPPAKPRKPAPPAAEKTPQTPYRIEDDDLIPRSGERPPEEPGAPYVDFDQAWKIPEPTELRDILHALEHGETIEDEEEPEEELG